MRRINRSCEQSKQRALSIEPSGPSVDIELAAEIASRLLLRDRRNSRIPYCRRGSSSTRTDHAADAPVTPAKDARRSASIGGLAPADSRRRACFARSSTEHDSKPVETAGWRYLQLARQPNGRASGPPKAAPTGVERRFVPACALDKTRSSRFAERQNIASALAVELVCRRRRRRGDGVDRADASSGTLIWKPTAQPTSLTGRVPIARRLASVFGKPARIHEWQLRRTQGRCQIWRTGAAVARARWLTAGCSSPVSLSHRNATASA